MKTLATLAQILQSNLEVHMPPIFN